MKGVKCFSYFTLFTCFVIIFLSIDWSKPNGVQAYGRRRKIELAKKLAGALFLYHKNKKLLFPLPLPFPLPIPVFKSYQPVIHDPLFFKHQMIKQHLGGHLGGITGLGGFG